MGVSFINDLQDSIYDFYRLILPILQQYLNKKYSFWRIISVEEIVGNRTELYRIFDIAAGIDLFLITPEGIRGIANRVQWTKKPYNTFTIRKERWTGVETEYTKRKRAIEKGYLYPYYTIQSYITERRTGHLLSFAIAKTADIIELAGQKIEGVYEKVNFQDGNVFICVDWYLFKLMKKPIFIYNCSSNIY